MNPESARGNNLGSASDIELAAYWAGELEHPCADPSNPGCTMRLDWLREAKAVLADMEAKPVSEQNPFAVKLLQDAISKYDQSEK